MVMRQLSMIFQASQVVIGDLAFIVPKTATGHAMTEHGCHG